MELLERDEALATLAEARAAAARGDGRVVLVAGEPGIGKSALVERFVAELGTDTLKLVGACDDLSIPRPLGPLGDFVGCIAEAALAEAIAAGDAHRVRGLLLEEIEAATKPLVVVLEDVHWADDATLDTIQFLVRRIATLRVLVLLTYRPGEVAATHPLHATLAAMPVAATVYVDLAPLSRDTVDLLFPGDGDVVYRATRGNPFYVTELLACDDTAELPRSVAMSVLGRAARLDDDSRRLLELVSVIPTRTPAAILDRVLPQWPAAAEEPERKQLLDVTPTFVRFRHELARQAIRSSVPAAVRRRHHSAVLDVLLATGADAADVVHHAEAAGAVDVVAEYALVAARRAVALESNREAHSQYRRAVRHLERFSREEQAAVLAEFATSAYVLGRVDEAVPQMERAIELHTQTGDAMSAGCCTRILARLHWFAGDGELAQDRADEAVALLEPLGPSVELARAYGAQAQLAMNRADSEATLYWGTREIELADELGDPCTRAHGLVSVGTIEQQSDPHDDGLLFEAHAAADAAGDAEEGTRALTNLGYSRFAWVRPESARHHLEHALAYAREHERENLAAYAATTLGWLQLRAGEWQDGERAVRMQAGKPPTVPQLLAATIMTELAIRRGDGDAEPRLRAVTARAERTGELQRLLPVLALEVEHALLAGGTMPRERLDDLFAGLEARGLRRDWLTMHFAAWSAVAGGPAFGLDWGGPYGAMARCDWHAAADGFRHAGWPYERALVLSLLEGEAELAEAIEVARELGAAPLERRVARRMRELRLAVPRGPRASTRTNPAGLTARQVEVLNLLLDGLTNSEIADRLIVSPRTAEHHVAAVLGKIGAASRRDAGRRAADLGLVS